MGSILIRLDIDMKASGRTICLMEEEKLSILIRADIMESFSIEKDMGRGFLCKRGVFFRENSVTISLRVMALCRARMEIAIMGSGRIMRCMEKESIFGLTEISIRVVTKRGREKVLA